MTLRDQVFERDGGVCCCCGKDTEKSIRDMISYQKRRNRHIHRIDAIAMLAWDWTKSPKHKALWEMDHIQPKALGGEDELDNVQTLCICCHDKKTGTKDVPVIAKCRRKRKKHDEHKRRMAEKFGEGEDDERPIQ